VGQKKNIVVLGSTGSIGKRTLDVASALGDECHIEGLAAGRNWQELAKQARRFLPKHVAIADEQYYDLLKSALKDLPIEVSAGENAVQSLAELSEVNFVLCAIVGAQSILSVLKAIDAGKTVGLASKEALVLAGQEVMAKAREKHVHILPVDSEHSAVFQCLLAGEKQEVHRIILTASGGPFRDWPREKIYNASLEQALNHPTWSMGKKITIDSATMMNKALEIIEAKHLFDTPVDTIEVVIHPESIIHSLVEYCDGAMIGQFSLPDMALPIQYALTWPERREGINRRLNLADIGKLNFYKPDYSKFPALRLAYEVAARGGTCGAVFNAANEKAVEFFLAGKIKFGEITELVEKVLTNHKWISKPGLEELLQADQWAREEVIRCTQNC
jgi:1-deoxy-D-xylulose-5-phosphate reductoisomerase